MASKIKIKKQVEEDLDTDLDLEDQDLDLDEDGEEDGEEEEAPAPVAKKKTAPAPAPTVKKKTAPAPAPKAGLSIPGKKAAAPKVELEEMGVATVTQFNQLFKEELAASYPDVTLADAERMRAAFIATGEKLINKKVSFTLFFKKRMRVASIAERTYPPIAGKTDAHTLSPAHHEAKFRCEIGKVEKLSGRVDKKGKFIPSN